MASAERRGAGAIVSLQHWTTNLQQLVQAASSLGAGIGGMARQLKPSGRSGVSGKKWVRPDSDSTGTSSGEFSGESTGESGPEQRQDPATDMQAPSSASTVSLSEPATDEVED